MNELMKQLEDMVSMGLPRSSLPKAEAIRETVSQLRRLPMFDSLDDNHAEMVARILEERLGITMTVGAQLVTPDFEPWLPAAKVTINPFYWERYQKYLVHKSFARDVIAKTDEVTDRIVGLLENPAKEGPWKRRGMVVGHVQSGKTANYTGVICKAADAGYRLIIVIAGIHNNLRNQTQIRIDEGFIGWDTAKKLKGASHDGVIGVGRFDARQRPGFFTNSVKDFSRSATDPGVRLDDLKVPAILIIKKNTSTLKNVIEWLKEHNAKRGTKTISAPMLLIDDEADNASINTASDKGLISRINGQIRELLGAFERSCYVGYTATPFANIFIDPETTDDMLGEDLFPSDFIISLDPPSNYVGATRIFADRSPNIVRYIEDNEDLLPLVHKKEHRIDGLPESLITAIRAFILGRAIRLLRGHGGQHCSMLVNASRFTDVQERLRNEIDARLNEIQRNIRVDGALPVKQALANPYIAALHGVWEKEFSETPWADIQSVLNEAAAPIRVVTVNSRSSGALDYDGHAKSGLSVIAVGGYSLSRGLTLEGLMVSYFLRNSMMYDTLMQMGRWFGYRGGYEDLCRLWLPEEADGWYEHITEAIEELRSELRAMEKANATPREFGLRVRSHPDTLIVTARNKMGSGKKLVSRVGLANNFIETTTLLADQPALRANLEAARRLAAVMNASSAPHFPTRQGRLFENVPVDYVLDFLRAFRNHDGSILTLGDPVAAYISDRAKGELAKWQVLFASLGADKLPSLVSSDLGFPIIRQERRAGARTTASAIHVGEKQRVASRGVERIGVPDDLASNAERDFNSGERDTGNTNYPDRIYREVRPRPLLIVHLMKINANTVSEKEGQRCGTFAGLDQPVVAWSISFPKTQTPEHTVEYVVNTTWMRENLGDEDEDDEPRDDAA
ncbi:Z1 domain-containing protein [Bosea sp. BK604]|uniref:Z1 domain-containing protein n=1 Tax=Bosea sp. BK604 TaxID=2512180 RepID=UPI001043FDAE|nr:Z1 domain-containing protein [Bosea sp. BK604]TCR63176.1 Z1 domain-containing protein [Bosea sp. BK604]